MTARADSMPLRVVVVEDELVQRRQMRQWLERMSDVVFVGEAANGTSAVEIIDAITPDLVFLDIAMPEIGGLEVLARIAHAPKVIFTTAFRDYAVEAFELGAIDYLLKPFGVERLASAVQRVRARGVERPSIPERVTAVRDDGGPLERVFVRDRNGIVPVPIEDVVRLESDGDYTALITGKRRFLIALPLKVLYERIRGREFVRIHRQHVVNLAHVARVVQFDAARLEVHLQAGGKLVASRAGSQRLRSLLR